MISSLEKFWSKHKRDRQGEAPWPPYASAGVGRPKSKLCTHEYIHKSIGKKAKNSQNDVYEENDDSELIVNSSFLLKLWK